MNVVSAAFVPMTPLLFRHLSGQADPVADLRAEAVDAVREACRGVGQILVLCPVGGREAPGDWRDPSPWAAHRVMPTSLAEQVGAYLLELAGVHAPAQYLELPPESPDGTFYFGSSAQVLDDGTEVDATVALVVLGDGAAARSQGAPGHIDERSFAFDDAVAAALAAGDGAALTSYDGEVAEALMVTGRHTWRVARSLLPAPSWAELRHRSDPFGMTYFVALWHA